MNPLRVAVIGAGPAGLYSCEELLRSDPEVRIDLYEELPTPFGLVRYGVAPDHPKIKSVSQALEKPLSDPRVQFLGNVKVAGPELQWMTQVYHALILCSGSQSDRSLGIPGEELPGCYSASDFVAWYNGHPHFRQRRFLLDEPRVAVVGAGNVALDVARILLSDRARLAKTDISREALEALTESAVREVHLLVRRGPAQATFTNPELRELLELDDVALEFAPSALELDPYTRMQLEQEPDKAVIKRLELLAGVRPRPEASRKLVFRFLVSPTAIGGAQRVESLELCDNILDSRLRAQSYRAAGRLSLGAVFRSIGYLGCPVGDLPFDAAMGVIPHRHGRVDGRTGVYVAGWIKRGPSGVIGSNKACAKETVHSLLSDASEGRLASPSRDRSEFLPPGWIDFAGWKRLDDYEVASGQALGRPREKVLDLETMTNLARGNLVPG